MKKKKRSVGKKIVIKGHTISKGELQLIVALFTPTPRKDYLKSHNLKPGSVNTNMRSLFLKMNVHTEKDLVLELIRNGFNTKGRYMRRKKK